MANQGFTLRCYKPLKPCVAAAVLDITSQKSVQKVRVLKARTHWHQAPSRICVYLTARAKQLSPLARAVVRKWVCSIATTQTSDFIHAKDQGDLRNFNISVGVSDEFMQAVSDDADWGLVHAKEPDASAFQGYYQRADGKWVYRKIRARDLWRQIMESTYDHAEPGVLFMSKINSDNNLSYCEVIESTNPCGEQPLPDYGCCDLGSINLCKFVHDPFGNTPNV